MRGVLKWLGRAFVALVLLVIAVVALAPAEEIAAPAPFDSAQIR